MTRIGALALRGAGGEPVDFARTISGHGCTELPPMAPTQSPLELQTIVRVGSGKPRRIRLVPERDRVVVEAFGPTPSATASAALLAAAARLLRLDADLSGFYARAADDADLSWAVAGAGRMARSGSVFESLIQTLLTTNCAWSATVRMVTVLVEQLGEPAHGGGKAFPTADVMAAADESFYREVIRAGYRASSLQKIATQVADGRFDLAELESADLADDEVEARLLALPGIGPYAAAHMLMMLGRYSRLILDSWTRPTYARLLGKPSVSDAAIDRRFRSYGDHCGLAFWLYLTRDWLPNSPK